MRDPLEPFLSIGRAVTEQMEMENNAMEKIAELLPIGETNAISLTELANKLEIKNPYDNGLDTFIHKQLKKTSNEYIWVSNNVKRIRTKLENYEIKLWREE